MSKTKKEIDFLPEDPFALISIVGPNMPQEQEVWGIKIRGVAESSEAAGILAKKLLRIDNVFDIYTVDVGKFAPLNIKPQEVKSVEYQNEMLNDMIKKYVENTERANEEWETRKAEMTKQAMIDGRKEAQEELAKKPEHPVAVLARLVEKKKKQESLREQLQQIEEEIKADDQKFANYTQEEKDLAKQEVERAIEQHADPTKVEEIKSGVIKELEL
jgi:hypothetical protein